MRNRLEHGRFSTLLSTVALALGGTALARAQPPSGVGSDEKIDASAGPNIFLVGDGGNVPSPGRKIMLAG
jgi:hypothetical protein